MGRLPPTDASESQHQLVGVSEAARVPVPLTPAAFRELRDRTERLEAALQPARATAQLRELDVDREAPTWVPDPELQLAVAKLAALRSSLARAEVVACSGAAVVGCRVVVRNQEGNDETYVLVAPGEAATRAGRISCDSPLGRALLRRRVGDVAEVATPAGSSKLTLIHVSETCYEGAV
jgi:transcription elongation GreA/GreB family factor